MYRPADTSEEIDEDFDVIVLDLIDLMKEYWTSNGPYHGDPLRPRLRTAASPNRPLTFRERSL